MDDVCDMMMDEWQDEWHSASRGSIALVCIYTYMVHYTVKRTANIPSIIMYSNS